MSEGRSAIILVESAAMRDAAALARLLDFFGIQQRTIWADCASAEDARWLRSPGREVVLLTSATGVVLAESKGLIDATWLRSEASPFKMALVHAGAQAGDMPPAVALLTHAGPCRMLPQTPGPLKLQFSDAHDDICGPFSGLTVEGVTNPGAPLMMAQDKIEPIIMDPSQGNAALLGLGRVGDREIYFTTSTRVAGLGEQVKEKYFDIKQRLFDLLPFVMFIKRAFAGQIYKTDGVRACLIVDDPTLVRTYGHFDYAHIFERMRAVNFTTNVGFIPWNYRRSRRAIVNLAKSNSDRFSIAVHGCDHTKAEFGSRNESVLEWLASTANRRMESHKERHQLDFDRVMIFPQGIFSEESATALKRNNYWAAVNTDICATNDEAGVPLGELMDLAITKYHSFPIITRRYFWHGMENFAFDILLEKPCLIVTHHQDFKDDARHVLNGLEVLGKLKARLDWSTLGDVVQTLHKRQRHSAGRESVRVYAHENMVRNDSPSETETTFRKTEADTDMLDAVLLDGKRVEYGREKNACVVSAKMKPGQTVRLQFQYKKNPSLPRFESSVVRNGKVMLRRHMTEIRDRFLS